LIFRIDTLLFGKLSLLFAAGLDRLDPAGKTSCIAILATEPRELKTPVSSRSRE
jgi:hypothetical protein